MIDPNHPTRVSESTPDPFVGRTFDGYRVEEVIGRGGMGAVYKATQLSLGRAVAIKLLTQDLVDDPQFLERFHREAAVLSRLSHPNIVTVFDRGEVDGRPYLAMEYVEGTSLRDLMRRGPLSPQEALRLVSSVLSALDHAHGRGIIHRDIKPENVLLAKGGVVKVADFGLSRLLEAQDQTRLTRTHLVLGTYEYMSPEQREHAREADARSDLYATGVVLYEMLVGELPIGRFDLPSARRPTECDQRLDRIIERSLEKNPDQRYQEAIEMAGAVSAVLEKPSEEGSAPPPPAPAAAPPPDADYRPTRLEYHLDNIATLDHVLGTVCYVAAFLMMFGLAVPLIRQVTPHFWLLFIVGWYLRETAEELRKHKRSARTAQAVIAIIAGLTGVLLPFTIYSFWALFGHRGRTYYEARSRGLDTVDAARYTRHVLEGPAPAPTPPPPPRAPTPSEIPVQSMITSDVDHPGKPRPRRTSVFVTLGFVFFGLTAAALIAEWAGVTFIGAPVLRLAGGVSVGLLGVGFLHALLTPGVHGAGAAFAALLLSGLAGFLFMSVDAAEWTPRDPARIRLGRFTGPVDAGFADELLRDEARRDWLLTIAQPPIDLDALRLERNRSDLILYVDDEVESNRRVAAAAVQALVEAACAGGFRPRRIDSGLPDAFVERLRANPPPR